MLFSVLANIGANIVDVMMRTTSSDGGVGLFSVLVSLALVLPGFSVWIRRLHDTDRSGWWCLLVLVPIVGWIIMLIWQCTRGTVGPNRFGPDPLSPGAA